MQNEYFLNISYYKTHQQSITYKISVFYFVRDFLLVHIYLFILFFVVKGVWLFFIYLFSCRSISKYFRRGETNIYIWANLNFFILIFFFFNVCVCVWGGGGSNDPRLPQCRSVPWSSVLFLLLWVLRMYWFIAFGFYTALWSFFFFL